MATAAQKLEVFLEELDAYIAAGGDAAVPQVAVGRIGEDGKPYPLGRRAQYLRDRHAKRALPPEHVTLLEQRQGWAWDLADARWHQQLQAVQAHLSEHGSYEGLPRSVSMWLTRAKQALSAGDLDGHKAELVRALPHRGGVERFCSAAFSWLAAHPRTTLADVPAGTVMQFEGRPYNLAKSIWYYQRRGAGLEGTRPLSAEDRKALECLPGWDWGTPAQRAS